ncbi:glycoside hydrolase 5 family protein [Brachybacterium fresconis]|uniref:Endo-1,4-beta-mannosidase n=1 Tax=Brachybacterium fresconis TaxID=173363 RepID=A0ABS4YGN0_9MICO|nr:glycosyl hydrolase [Brachybacterium fresconis]MBP2407547.1 endo-1,4-beta-mannosidase [Brachybacterium fresconis]
MSSPASPAPPAPRFGVNYTPRTGWFHSWLDLDEDAVGEDLQAIASLGADHVRIFPLWPLLQPNRTLIRPRGLADVRAVVDAAASVGLDVVVDAIQGHLSSFDFIPSWLATWHRRNMFTDPEVVAATAELVRSLAACVADAPNLLGLTLGNEVNQFSASNHPDPDVTSVAEAEAWTRTLLEAARAGAPAGMHTVANYDAAWFMDDHAFTPDQSARLGDATVIHSWIFDGTGQRYGARSYEVAHRAEYYLELARAFSPAPQRPLWLQEVGAPRSLLTEDEVPWFVASTIENSLSCPELWGVTWWCSHDVSRSLADFPPLEHTLGLFDEHGRIKNAGEAFRDAVAAARETAPPASRGRAIEFPVGADALLGRSAAAPGGSVFEAWMDASRAGERPTVRVVREQAEIVAGDTRTGGAAATRVGS